MNPIAPTLLHNQLQARPASAALAEPLSANGASAVTQAATSAAVFSLPPSETSSIQKKGRLVNYLFDLALSTLGSLEVHNKPSLFLIYAHNNPKHGKAGAETSKYLIEKLFTGRVNLYSDQTPTGQRQPYSRSQEELKADGKLEDILTSQLCLLPDRLIGEVKPVDRVVVCCSEVLGNYLKEWPHYQNFYQRLREAYRQDLERQSASAIREVLREFSQEGAYKFGFHHVLTEIAFLQIRVEQRDERGVIPVTLTANSYERCLSGFIPSTTVRIEDILRLEGRSVYPNQGQHVVLFKLIERLLGGNNEVKTFLDQFWQGYDKLISHWANEFSTFDELEFAKLLGDIFKGINAELSTQLIDQARKLSQMHKQYMEAIQKQLPLNLSSSELREALYQHYQSQKLSIQRVSGLTASLEDCYINLAIVESQAQREKNREELKKQAATFERLPSSERLDATNPNKLIALDQLFEPQEGKTEAPKRILIYGRAGIGKTTLCKKLVYEYHHKKLWQDRFDCVLWIPLRQLKTYQAHHLEKLLCEHYFASQGSRQAQALAQAFHSHQDKTLFILDGLDEVADELNGGRPLRGFLQTLLDKKYMVITSRPAGVNTHMLGHLDLELETIGFSPDNVQAYIQNERHVPKANQAAIQQFIDRTPLIQGLVNIPIQLDALCYSWDNLPKNQEVTMTTLYKAMVDKLWRKDSVRLEKKEDGQLMGADIIENLSAADLEELMAVEIDYLGYLAFKGLEAGKIEFSRAELSQRRGEFNGLLPTGRRLPLGFTTNLKKTSYLHTVETDLPESDRHYHFLHLTFQEFFAAKFLARHLQAYSDAVEQFDSASITQAGLGLMLSEAQLQALIAQHKYDPRYEIVWWMVAGSLKGATVEHFFTLLGQAPRDLIGARHQQVMMGCLREARGHLNPETVMELEEGLMWWLHFEMRLSRHKYVVSKLGSQNTFPEHILVTYLRQTGERKNDIIYALRAHSVLSEAAIEALIGGLEDSMSAVVDTLAEQKALPDTALTALIDAALQDQSRIVSSAAVNVLSRQTTLPRAAFMPLINALRSPSLEAKSTAAWALTGQKTLPDAALTALIDALRNSSLNVKIVAARALGGQAAQSEAAFKALINALWTQPWEIRNEVERVLAKQKTLPQAALNALAGTLQAPSLAVKTAAVCVLGGQITQSKVALDALIGALEDPNLEVRITAVKVLGSKAMLPKVALDALIGALQDPNLEVKITAVDALGGKVALSKAALDVLVDGLQDRSWYINSEATNALAKQETLSEAALKALISNARYQDWKIKIKAMNVLARQKIQSEAILNVLIGALQHQNLDVRAAAAIALAGQKTLPRGVLRTVIGALQSEAGYFKAEAARALAKQKTLPESVLWALIGALWYEKENVKTEVARALAEQEALPRSVLKALTDALQHEDKDLKTAAAHALAGQKALPEDVLKALIGALQYKEASIRSSIVGALELNLNQLYRMLPVLEVEQIQTLYREFLFGYSCDHIAPLYVQGNELHFYTEAGPGRTGQIEKKKMDEILQAFELVCIQEGMTPIV